MSCLRNGLVFSFQLTGWSILGINTATASNESRAAFMISSILQLANE